MSYDAKSEDVGADEQEWQLALRLLREARAQRRRVQARHDVTLALVVIALFCLLWWMGARS